MRILLVTQYYWPEQFKVTDLAEAFAARGHVVTILTGMPNYPVGSFFEGYGALGPFTERRSGIDILRVPIVPRGRGRWWELVLNYASFVFAATARLILRWRSPWDVALVFQLSPVTSGIPALILRALRGTPVAIWVQDLWPESIRSTGMVRNVRVFSGVGWLSDLIYRSCDLVIGQSRAFQHQLASRGIRDDRLEYLPNWAEDTYGPVPATAGDPAAWEQGFCVMFAGNLGRAQALDTVLEAADLLRDDLEIQWAILGDGVLREWMEREVLRRGLSSVHFLGRQPVEEMPGYFARASAMLVSLKPDEWLAMTIPSKLQSYLACGRPILGSLDGEGARVIGEAGAGFCSPAGDAPALASVVLRMKALPATDREAFGRAGLVYCVREFGRSGCIAKMERLLEGLRRNEE